ncbi:MAG TPA: hypothetical protein VHN37_01905 [Actinomycetota bacterium]|nr:hypothetical protein [Actinomycetota bacterium]
MSVVLPAMKKTIWPLTVALSVAALSAVWLLAADRVSIGAGRGAAVDPAIPQAAWEVKAYAAPTAAGINEADKAVFAREREDVVDTIQRLYEALFLRPDALDKTVRATMTDAASKVLAASRIGLHDEVEDVRTTTRFLKVGIQVDDGLRAAAVVRVQANALRRSSPITVWHRAQLWLEKENGRWQVVAFDAEQGRLP